MTHKLQIRNIFNIIDLFIINLSSHNLSFIKLFDPKRAKEDPILSEKRT